jgi:hypothetical protein
LGFDSPATTALDFVKGIAGATTLSQQMNVENGGSSTPADYLQAFLERRACFVKHSSFETEREYRLLVDGVFWNLHHLQFRATRSSLAPYIQVRIPRHHSDMQEMDSSVHLSALAGRWDFVDLAVIGPTANKNLTRDAVKASFNRETLNVEVDISVVPFRDW